MRTVQQGQGGGVYRAGYWFKPDGAMHQPGETIRFPTLDDLQAPGHDVARIKACGMNGCATAVQIDPATGNRIAGATGEGLLRDCVLRWPVVRSRMA